MGTDISLYVEIKDKSRKWHIVKKPAFPCRQCKDPDYENECIWCNNSEVFISRNYILFTVLAGVKGWNLPDGWKIISAPKGIPKNVSEELRELLLYGNDDHTLSYYTYSQLKKYNWEEVDKDEFTNVLIPLLHNLSEKHSGDSKVRIVFGFDN